LQTYSVQKPANQATPFSSFSIYLCSMAWLQQFVLHRLSVLLSKVMREFTWHGAVDWPQIVPHLVPSYDISIQQHLHCDVNPCRLQLLCWRGIISTTCTCFAFFLTVCNTMCQLSPSTGGLAVDITANSQECAGQYPAMQPYQ
jgi:hypothetical protein